MCAGPRGKRGRGGQALRPQVAIHMAVGMAVPVCAGGRGGAAPGRPSSCVLRGHRALAAPRGGGLQGVQGGLCKGPCLLQQH